ncbi:MAG: hypothetical protein HQ567_07820 [Candidatus Nealsonbacteria bacterium]|nr:hypothetical protein [Candidatus Nealsonbacteria bacterium]
MDHKKALILELSLMQPALAYDPTRRRAWTSASPSPAECAREYLYSQPCDYRNELNGFYTVNARRIRNHAKYYVFVVCYNELANLRRIAEMYGGQLGISATDLVLCYVVNFTPEPGSAKSARDYDVFCQSVDSVLDLQRDYPFVHLLAKQFRPGEGGLSRARKYGMDYCLHCFLMSTNVRANHFIVSNEGDMLSIPVSYLLSYDAVFSATGDSFVQGAVHYPEEVKIAPLLDAYTRIRESVHLGQGMSPRHLNLDGIMPIGRNYAISPKLVALSGGIDPIFSAGAEDDLVFGADLQIVGGDKLKQHSPIPLTTSPRREIMIVRDLLEGRNSDAKRVYENFHSITDIYDHNWEWYKGQIPALAEYPATCRNTAIIANQFYQWVHRTVAKRHFADTDGFGDIITRYRQHDIAYWARENALLELYRCEVGKMPVHERLRLYHEMANEALAWFNDLIPDDIWFEAATFTLESCLADAAVDLGSVAAEETAHSADPQSRFERLS